MNRHEILGLVVDERARQHEKWHGLHDWGYGDCSSPDVAWPVKLAVLMEEVGELANAILERDTEGIRLEAVQVAAVAVAILEGLGDDGVEQ